MIELGVEVKAHQTKLEKHEGDMLRATIGVPPSIDEGACSMDGDSIHESLYILVDSVTRGRGRYSANRIG